MSRTYRSNGRGNRRIRVRGVRRKPADLKRLSRALVELAKLQQAEAETLAANDQPGKANRSQHPNEEADQQDTNKRDSA